VARGAQSDAARAAPRWYDRLDMQGGQGTEDGERLSIPAAVPVVGTGATVAARYCIQSRIGRGGMGSVYRAHDTLRGRDVALKSLDVAEHTDGRATRAAAPSDKTQVSNEARQRTRRRAQLVALFQREYHTLAQLEHPRIVQVFDYGVFEGRPYYTMELLEGQDLSKAGAVPWKSACSLLRDVASALTLLHARRMLHRDVSPRNVLRSPEGHAKLLDFGAMTSMGVAATLVGTPAFVAPEALQRQALDARADLYSLGALGYLLLTGRPPYPVHEFGQLRDAYRTRVAPPSALAPGVPKALDALVMQLVAIDRAARPGSAVEVVERLTAIAGLPYDPRLSVASAYLSTPTLVGRATELLAVRRRALRALRGHGSSVLASGPPGVGRSRFLDAAALEGKLSGALVLRTDPTAAGGADYGALRSLLMQVHTALTDTERALLPLPAAVSEQLLPGLSWLNAASKPASIRPAPPSGEDDSALSQLVHEYVVALARQRSVMIAVDDMHAIDGHSAALIAGLGEAAARCRLVIVAAYDSTYDAQAAPRAQAALELLAQYSREVALSALRADDTHALLRSVFGDVPNLVVVGSRLHALCEGNPSLCMELARHLIDSGVVRYEAGGFVLPEELPAEALPQSFDQVLLRRVARLSPEARELGALLALTAGAPLTVGQCLALAGAGDAALAQRTLGELAAADTVLIREDYVALRQSAFGAALLDGSGAAQQQALHLRLGEVLRGDPMLRFRAADHFFRAGQPGAALDLLVMAPESDVLMYEWFAGYDALMARAIDACRALGRSRRDTFALRRARAYNQMHYLEPCDKQQLLALMHELERMSGLVHHRALGDAVDPQQRLARALEAAGAEYAATPAHERVYSPVEAITELTSFLPLVAAYGTATLDNDLLEQVCSLAPYRVLAPGVELAQRICTGMAELRAGRHGDYVRAIEWLLARLAEPDGAGLPERRRVFTRLSVLFVAALTDAVMGRPRAFARAKELDAVPRMRGNAWRVRQIAHLYRGEAHEADACRRQVELFLLQEGARQAHHGSTLETEFMAYARSDDLLGLRRALHDLERMAAQHPPWQPALLLGRAELERIRGRLEPALALYEEGLRLVAPGRHMMWPYLAGLHVRALVELGRVAEARALGLSRLAECERLGIDLMDHELAMALSAAEAALGEHDTAIARVEARLARLEREGVSGLYAGELYELRARLALGAGDARFDEYFESCKAHYGSALDSPFTARLSRLAAEARASAEQASETQRAQPARVEHLSADGARRALSACDGADARARCALALLVESAHAPAGYLYGVRAGALFLLAASPGRAPDAHVERAVSELLEAETWLDRDVTQVAEPVAAAPPSRANASIVGHDRSVYTPYAIGVERGADYLVGAVAVLVRAAGVGAPAAEVLGAIGDALFERGDVTGFTLLA
jgi:serine/threonine protein kinase